VVHVSSAVSMRCHIPVSGKRTSPAFYWFHERPRQQVLLENAPSTELVKGHVSEGGERCLRMPVGAIREKDEGEIDSRGQNDREMKCIDIIVKQAVG